MQGEGQGRAGWRASGSHRDALAHVAARGEARGVGPGVLEHVTANVDAEPRPPPVAQQGPAQARAAAEVRHHRTLAREGRLRQT